MLLEQFSVSEEEEKAGGEEAKAANAADDDEDDDEISGDSWLGHKLSFEAERAILAKDANTKGDDWFDIYDPRDRFYETPFRPKSFCVH
jgi:peptidyl-prolyl cis-trans isomerase SDCCAG10